MPTTFSLLALLRRSWWVLLLSAAVAGAVAYLVADRIPPTYRGEARFIVGPINADASVLSASGNLARTYAEVAVSRPVLRASIRAAGAALTVEEAQDRVTTSANDVTRVVTVVSAVRDARLAARFSNAIVDELQQLAAVEAAETARRAEEFLEQPELEVLAPAERVGVHEAAVRMGLLGESPAGRINVIQPAEPPLEPAGPGPLLIAILGVLAGGTIAAIIALIREVTRVAVTAETIRGDLGGIEYLGRVDVPASPTGRYSLLSDAARESPAAAGYRLLSTRIGSARAGGRPQTLLLLDVDDGRTSAGVAAHLAAALAEANPRVVVLDDAATPHSVAAWFGVDQHSRDEDSLGARNGVDPAKELVRVALGSGVELHVLTLDDSNGSVTLHANREEHLLERLRSRADVIVISAAPLHRGSWGAAWARVAGATILALEEGRTPRDAAAETLRTLTSADTNVLGVVLARRRPLRELVRRLTPRRRAPRQAPGTDGESTRSSELERL